MNRHERRALNARKVEKIKLMKLPKINIRLFEKLSVITKLQEDYLRQRLVLVKEGSKAAIRIAKILTMPRTPGIIEIHEKIIEGEKK